MTSMRNLTIVGTKHTVDLRPGDTFVYGGERATDLCDVLRRPHPPADPTGTVYSVRVHFHHDPTRHARTIYLPVEADPFNLTATTTPGLCRSE